MYCWLNVKFLTESKRLFFDWAVLWKFRILLNQKVNRNAITQSQFSVLSTVNNSLPVNFSTFFISHGRIWKYVFELISDIWGLIYFRLCKKKFLLSYPSINILWICDCSYSSKNVMQECAWFPNIYNGESCFCTCIVCKLEVFSQDFVPDVIVKRLIKRLKQTLIAFLTL